MRGEYVKSSYQGFVKNKLSDILIIVTCAVPTGSKTTSETSYLTVLFELATPVTAKNSV